MGLFIRRACVHALGANIKTDLSVHLYECTKATTAERISMEFCTVNSATIYVLQFRLISDSNGEHFKQRPTHISAGILSGSIKRVKYLSEREFLRSGVLKTRPPGRPGGGGGGD